MGQDSTLKTTATSLDVLETLIDLDGGRVAELSESLDLPPSTVYTHLATLYQKGYLVKEGDLYRPSMKLVSLGENVRNRSEAYRLARAKVRELAKQTGLRAHFIVEESGQGHYLYSASGENAVKAFAQAGKHAPLHVSAAGKAILSALPRTRVEEIVDEHGLSPATENTITDIETLWEELDTVREQGYAFNREEHLNGVWAIGAPVTGKGDRVVGALSVAGPVYRLNGKRGEEEIPETLLSITNELELNIIYS